MNYGAKRDSYEVLALQDYFPCEWRLKSDSDIENIGRILHLSGYEEWGRSPRVYSILRMLLRLDAMSELLANGLRDVSLPVNPPVGDAFQALGSDTPRFFRAQELVIPPIPSRNENQAFPSEHLFAMSEAGLGLISKEKVACDTSGSVDIVFDSIGNRMFTRKRFIRTAYKDEPMHFARITQAELTRMKNLRHSHCLQLVGSYTTLQHLSLLFFPAAKFTLWEFLESPWVRCYCVDGIRSDVTKPWLGCLASALVYLESHGFAIHTGAIRAENILVHGPDVFLSAITLKGSHDVNTLLEADDLTRQLAMRTHNSVLPTTIFHLGIVYLQLMDHLAGQSPERLENHMREMLRLGLTKVFEKRKNDTNYYKVVKTGVLDIIHGMLMCGKEDAPTLKEVASKVTRCESCADQLSLDSDLESFHPLVLKDDYFSELDVKTISKRLENSLRPDWALLPRIYIILCRIGRLDLMPTFLKEDLTDILIPFDESLLRQLIKDRDEILEFLKTQEMVLSKHFVPEEHQYFTDGNDHFQEIRRLGSGGFGSVSHCIDPVSKMAVAKKVIPRGRVVLRNRSNDSTNLYQRELAVLSRISKQRNRHLVSLIGSYTDAAHFAILSLPIADMNLATYLDTMPDIGDIAHWFGCLAMALRFLHNTKIRHKDIKPQNCLVHGDNIILTDFGLSFDWNDKSRPTTSGRVEARDRQYCAPEVAEWQQRNASSDIWGLGCVYLEMYSVLHGYSRKSIKEYFMDHGSQSPWYHENRKALKSWLSCLREKALKEKGQRQGTLSSSWLGYRVTETYPLNLIQRMMLFDKDKRPTSEELVNEMFACVSRKVRRTFCGRCCIDEYNKCTGSPEDESDEEDWTVITETDI